MIRRPLVVLMAASVLVALGACSQADQPKEPGAPKTGTVSPSVSPTPTPSAAASMDPSTLFRITADLVSPEGARVNVVETAYATSSVSGDARAAWSAAGCDAHDVDLDPAAVVRVVAVASVADGPAPDPNYLLALNAGTSVSSEPTGFTGDWRTAQAYCADGYLSMPGTATGWTGLESEDGWTSGRWGVGADTGAGEDMRSMTATTCTLDRGPASSGLTLPTGWDSADTRFGCFFGARP